MENTQMVEAVTESLHLLAKTLANPPKIDEELVRMWASLMGMAQLSPDQVRTAAARLSLTQEFFPQPRHFIEVIRPNRNRDAACEMAWQAVLECVRRYGGNASLYAQDFGGDRAVLWALERMNWIELCEVLDIENRNLKRAEFVRAYTLACEMRVGQESTPGRIEMDNRFKGNPLSPAFVGRPDLDQLPAPAAAPPALPPASAAPASQAGPERPRPRTGGG